jgi:hypothetical protein
MLGSVGGLTTISTATLATIMSTVDSHENSIATTDEINFIIEDQGIRDSHYKLMSPGWYAGYDHKLRIVGGVDVRKICEIGKTGYYGSELRI